MSVLTKRLPNGRIEYKYLDRFGEYKRITGHDAEFLTESNFPNYGATDAEANFEEVQLDDFEVNTGDDVPLIEETSFSELAEAGGVTTTGTVAAPSTTTAIGTGVGIGLGTIAIGTTIGVINKEDGHKDPVVSLPDHRYIGPGNTIDDTEPVDLDDSIAKEHDINYEKAKTQEDVQEADRQGADEFLSDFIDNKNPHSAIGYIGLKAKEKFESIVGVQYPPNLPSVSGMSNSRVARALGKYPVDKDPRKHADFPKRHEYSTGQYVNRVRYIWDQWNRARQNRGLPRVDPPKRLGIETTMRPPLNKKTGQRPNNQSITFREWQDRNSGKAGPLIEAFKAGRNVGSTTIRTLLDHATFEEIPESERMEIEAILRDIDSGSISIADFDNTDGAGPSNAPQYEAPQDGDMANTRGQKRQNDEEQGGGPTPPQPSPVEAVGAAAASGTGHNSGSDGGFDSAQGPVSFLPKGGYQAKGGMMKFKKVHRMKSWAIPYWNLSSATYQSGSNLVTTPLAKIPWEYAFFYLSPEEFNLLPAGSYIDSVHIKVMQTVASTGYPTGGTTASIATTNHPKVLIVAKDLESKCRGGTDRSLDLTNEMIPALKSPDETAKVTFDNFIIQQYGTDQTVKDADVIVPGACHKIPFYNPLHWCIYQPNRVQALAREFFSETTPGVVATNNSPGFEYFQNYVTELNSNDTTWDFVDSMSYKFENAPIGIQYQQLEILTDKFTQSTGSSIYFNAKRNVTNAKPGGDLTFTETFVGSTRNTLPMVTYKSAPMEFGSYFVRGDKAGKPSRQPTFHIGMRAIDKLDPSVNIYRASTFVQANIEFEIEATMYVNLPAYPNRFVKPKYFNTSIENAVMGINAYPAHTFDSKFVTFGLFNEETTAPIRAAVDAEDCEPNEENVNLIPGRSRRTLPNISKLVKCKK